MYNINGKYCGATIHGSLVETEAIAQVYDFCNHPIAENAKVVIMPDCHAGKGCTVGFTAEIIVNEIKDTVDIKYIAKTVYNFKG